MDSLDSTLTTPRRRADGAIRAAAGLTLATLLVTGCSALGAKRAGGDSGQPAGAALASGSTASAESAWITLLGGAHGSAASLSTTALPGGRAGHARWAHAIARIRSCLAGARKLRANGHLNAARAARRACRRGYLRLRLALLGAMHGQVTYSGAKGTRTVAFERGVVKTVSAGSVVVTASDGTTWTWDLVTSTAIVAARHRVSSAALTAGQHVVVIGPVVSGSEDARLILIRR